jgi:hypothetical protein
MMASILNMVKGNAMKTILYFLIIILSLFPSFSFSGEGSCVQGDCINGQGRKIYSDGKIHDGYWVEGQYVGKGQTVDYLIKQKEIAEKMNTKEEFEEKRQNEEEKAINQFSYIEILMEKYGEKCKQYCKVNEDEYNKYCYEVCLAFHEKEEMIEKKKEGSVSY